MPSSVGALSKQRSQTSASKPQHFPLPPAPTLTPENVDRQLEPCDATATCLLRAQGSVILCLDHESLAVERKFEKHLEDVRWICVDNVSERGTGRLVVSYDTGNTAIIWDLYTGGEIARFSAYEEILVAAWMRNGNIAFGNSKGNIILFEPSTSEHISSRTIFDPVTALAPATDCRSFAIGYFNGSILIATLQPYFTILHSLTTNRKPSRIIGLAWHGSSSKQKSEMLAAQSRDGDLRVWSVPKTQAQGDNATVIRVLNKLDSHQPGPCWFAWSRNGRIIQYCDGETRSWDVRTKHVTCESVPTIDSITGIANHGPTSVLYSTGSDYTIQKYDVNPEAPPLLVKEVKHLPADTPPSPPNSVSNRKTKEEGPNTAIATLPPLLPTASDTEASESDNNPMSPLEKIKQEMDRLEEDRERRDILRPLSPTSSRTSSISTRSSRGKRQPSYRYDQPSSSRASNFSRDNETEFSFGMSLPRGRDSVSTSIRSSTSYRSSRLRQEVQRSPDEPGNAEIDLFPYTKARLHDVAFQVPTYGAGPRTPNVLRQEMLRVVFGWHGDIEELIRDELSGHRPSSASAVLLTKWLGDSASDSLVSMMGSQSMTSADWMLLALSSIAKGSQKQVGEAFVQRLLEKGDVHPAVAILLGIGEHNDAIEAYVSQGLWLEALLLTCLVCPADWGRQSFLLRKWGEVLVASGSPELAVRCFSCTSIETSEAWFSPTAQDAVFAAQKDQVLGPASPPLSPPSASGSIKLRNAQLKVITTFGDKGIPVIPLADTTLAPMNLNTLATGVTPIAQSALSPTGDQAWARMNQRERDLSTATSARTATPGAYSRSRLSSRQRTNKPSETPQTASKDLANVSILLDTRDAKGERQRSVSRSESSVTEESESEVPIVLSPAKYERKVSDPTYLPSPAAGAFARLRLDKHIRNGSRDRIPDGLQLHLFDSAAQEGTISPSLNTASTSASALSNASSAKALTGKADEPYLSSLETARQVARRERADSRAKPRKDRSASRGRLGQKYIRPAKRSPSSPIPMSPQEISSARDQGEHSGGGDGSAAPARVQSRNRARVDDVPSRKATRSLSRQRHEGPAHQNNDIGDERQGRNVPHRRSPSLQLPARSLDSHSDEPTDSDGMRPQYSNSSRRGAPRTPSPHEEAETETDLDRMAREDSGLGIVHDVSSLVSPSKDESLLPATSYRDQSKLTRKQLAAKELEERRLSLARRPSAPAIPAPGDAAAGRPGLGPRYYTELGDSPLSFLPPMSGPNISRSQTADPEAMMRSASRPTMSIGLPATPRAMKHPQYMGTDPDKNDLTEMPSIPEAFQQLPSISFRSTGSREKDDELGPLLPSTVFSYNDPISRSVSAPIERDDSMPSHRAYKATLASATFRHQAKGHSRRSSADVPIVPPQTSPNITASIDETIHDTEVIIVDTSHHQSSILPELLHLAMPPPPPPPPVAGPFSQTHTSTGVINIAMSDNTGTILPTSTPGPPKPPPLDTSVSHILPRASTASPSMHRRGRGSISENSTSTAAMGTGISSRFRNVTERMRSTSRARAKSPPVAMETHRPSPYETKLPPLPAAMPAGVVSRRESLSRAKSPLEKAVSPVGGGFERRPSRNEGVVSPGAREREKVAELRANMPPNVDVMRMDTGIGEGEMF